MVVRILYFLFSPSVLLNINFFIVACPFLGLPSFNERNAQRSEFKELPGCN